MKITNIILTILLFIAAFIIMNLVFNWIFPLTHSIEITDDLIWYSRYAGVGYLWLGCVFGWIIKSIVDYFTI